MSQFTTRRRFLTISAAALIGQSAFGQDVPETRWRGRALGASTSIRVRGLDPKDAGAIVRATEQEIRRLEAIFSLYHPDSALVRLNQTGALRTPPPELLEVLSLANTLYEASDGAFDPTIQPVFATHAKALEQGRVASDVELATAWARVGWASVQMSAQEIRLTEPGSALSLNGIAQGYITDRVADLLKAQGLRDVLVDAGEISAQGMRPGGGPWTAGVATPDGEIVRRLELADRALATSASLGTRLDALGRVGHIFDPIGHEPANGSALIAVSAPRAVVADGLSTALCVVPIGQRDAVLAAFAGARLEVSI